MQLLVGSNAMIADTCVALDVSGREHLVVVAKASWHIPLHGQRPRPLTPEPLVDSDAFYGQPGASALRYGSDFARFKPRCDVVFDAVAHAPGGKATKQMDVFVRVGQMSRRIRVHGPRRWRRLLGVTSLGQAEPFMTMPLHHGFAYGGERWYKKGDVSLCEALLSNPSGLGFAGRHTSGQVNNVAAPSLEDPLHPVKSPGCRLKPMALSPVARHWSPRRELAGTYDEAWKRDVFPFLPDDFDEAFNQVAPPEQQVPYLTGGEPVELQGVLPNGDVSFVLPNLKRAVRVLRTDYSQELPTVVVDTLHIETEAGRFSAIWRASVPIRRWLHEFSIVTVGPVDEAWWAAKARGELDGGCDGCQRTARVPAEEDLDEEQV